jgi:hypothetical protein
MTVISSIIVFGIKHFIFVHAGTMTIPAHIDPPIPEDIDPGIPAMLTHPFLEKE